MTEQEIHHSNLAIAGFLDWFQQNDITGKLEDGTWFVKTDYSIIVAYSEYKNYPFKGLPFYRDWNWLMFVVDKIEKLGYKCTINKDGIHWCDDNKSQHMCYFDKKDESRFAQVHYVQAFGDIKIEAIYNTVIKFIEKYNKKKHETRI